MEKLIVIINELQLIIKKSQCTEINIPEVVVIGSQSSGKSSVLERIIDCDILPKGPQIATKCPIILQLIHNVGSETLTGIFQDKQTVVGLERIQQKLQIETDKIQQIRESPIIVTLHGNNLPSLTLIDLPGIIKNVGVLPKGSVEAIQNLSEKYASSPNSIILAVSAANVDLANSDSIQISRKYDPLGHRTLNVITKIDLMDSGTDARDILKSTFVQKSLGIFFLVNRSQAENNERKLMKSVKEKEIAFFNQNYKEIAENHGIKSLVQALIQKLCIAIKENLPRIVKEIRSRKSIITDKLGKLEKSIDEHNVVVSINKFIDEYSKLINGEKSSYPDTLVGGAQISKIIYDRYAKEILDLKVDELTDKYIKTLIQNTTGIKYLTYSIEKTFFILTKKESDKFWQPNLNAIEDTAKLLKKFVEETILEIGILENIPLKDWIVDQMQDLIDEKYKYTEKMIKDILRCEKDQMFCSEPNSEWFTSLKHDFEGEKMKVYSDNFGTFFSWVSLLPANLMGSFYPNFMKSEKDNNASKECQFEVDTRTLRNMVKGYFSMTQKNFILNTPKWIQTFMVFGLIEDMKINLTKISDSDRVNLQKVDSEILQEISECDTEYKQLEEIEHHLRKYMNEK